MMLNYIEDKKTKVKFKFKFKVVKFCCCWQQFPMRKRSWPLREAFKKKEKKKYGIFHTWVWPPPTMENFSMYFFSETRPLLGHFLKKSVFCPPEMSNTCKNFQNSKIGQKWLSVGPPPSMKNFILFKVVFKIHFRPFWVILVKKILGEKKGGSHT